MSAFAEGILSLHQLISIVLSEKIPGLETGHQALEALVKGGKTKLGLATELTMRLPMGLLGPMALSGYSLRQPLSLSSSGHLEISETGDTTLKAMQDLFVGSKSVCPMAMFFRGQSNRSALAESGDSSGTANPQIDHTTGIQTLAEMYLKIYEAVETGEVEHPERLSSTGH